ncbi:MAG: polyprenyl synthetase family protein [Alkalispirochaetaceae bacterium]
MSIGDAFAGTVRGLVRHALEEEGLEVEGATLLSLLEGYLARPASLLRPRLLLATAESYGADPRTVALTRLAAATELLHLFALMHDDVLDEDGREGVELPGPPEREPSLLLTGDLLHSLAISIIETTVEQNNLSRRILTQIRSISLRTIVGQSRDLSFLREGSTNSLPGARELYRLYDLKTGYYSFVAPLTIGAIAAGSEDIDGLERVGLLLGRAYQLRDDRRDSRRFIEQGRLRAVMRWELNLLVVLLAAEGRTSEAREILTGEEPSPETRAVALALLDGAAGAGKLRELLLEALAAGESLEPGVSLVKRLMEIARLSLQ